MNFYESDGMSPKIEFATLLEDIVLPQLPPFPTMDEIHSGEIYFPRTIDLYEDVVGKFSIPIISPLGDNTGDPREEEIFSRPTNIVNDSNIEISTYKKSNFLELTIPKYIVMNFMDKIPKQTKFIVCFVGESLDIEDIKIIGVGERYV